MNTECMTGCFASLEDFAVSCICARAARKPQSQSAVRSAHDSEHIYFILRSSWLRSGSYIALAKKIEQLYIVDASLDLFTRKSPRIWRDLLEKRALSARRLILWMVGV